MEDVLREVIEEFDKIVYAYDECRKLALAEHDFDNAKYLKDGIYFTEKAKDDILKVIVSHI